MCNILPICCAYLRIICICIVKVSYKAQLYVIMYNLCYIKAINSDNVGVMLHNFARLVLFFIKLVCLLVWFYTLGINLSIKVNKCMKF